MDDMREMALRPGLPWNFSRSPDIQGPFIKGVYYGSTITSIVHPAVSLKVKAVALSIFFYHFASIQFKSDVWSDHEKICFTIGYFTGAVVSLAGLVSLFGTGGRPSPR